MTAWRNGLKWLGIIALAGVLCACSAKVELMAALPEAEANEILAALQNAHIPAEKVPGKEGMVGVTIAADKVGRAVDLLREKGLPRERFAGMGQVFKKEGLISSPLEERARYLYALSQELADTLSRLDGVVVARVHVVLPERGPIGEAALPSSAAVFIKHQDGYDLDMLQPLIRRLVTNSIPGLTPEKVSIVLVNTQPAPAVAARHDEAPVVSTGPNLLPVVVALGLMLLASIGLSGFLVWRRGWPWTGAGAPSADRS